jgi:hypothetical protein
LGIFDRWFGAKPAGIANQEFWSWFAAHETDYRNLTSDKAAAIRELGRRLSRVHPGLTFEIGPADTTSGSAVHEFAVSADGIHDRFPAVLSLVNDAPQIDGWRIVAFRQRKPDSFWNVVINGTPLDLNDVWVQVTPAGPKVDILLYVRGLTQQNARPLMEATMLLLDSALGEYDIETHIGSIDWAPLPTDPVAMQLRPFRELPTVFDRLIS